MEILVSHSFSFSRVMSYDKMPTHVLIKRFILQKVEKGIQLNKYFNFANSISEYNWFGYVHNFITIKRQLRVNKVSDCAAVLYLIVWLVHSNILKFFFCIMVLATEKYYTEM